MGAKVQDYKDLITTLKYESQSNNDSYLDCTAKELMGKIGSGNETLITCCSAMRQMMLAGDEILIEPKGKKGVSTKMTIRYYINDLDRASAYMPKKRGRKAKVKEHASTSLFKNNKIGRAHV